MKKFISIVVTMFVALTAAAFTACGERAQKVTVSFSADDQSIPSETYTVGQPYGQLPRPEDREYYSFYGWSTEEGGDIVTADTLVAADNSTLYAQWEYTGSIVSVSAGTNHVLAVGEDGSLWGWGNNSRYQRGDESTQTASAPSHIKEDVKFSKAYAGDQFSLALDERGTLWGWGSNSYGQVGIGNWVDPINEPNQILPGTKFIEAAAGGYGGYAIDEDGNLYAWGSSMSNLTGMLENINEPAHVAVGTKFKTVSAAESDVYAIDEDGNVWGAGVFLSNTLSQLTEGTIYTAVYSGGMGCGLAIDEDGNLREISTGSNFNRQIMPGKQFKSAGIYSVMGKIYYAIEQDGTLWAWGDNRKGQLGDGSYNDADEPEQIMPEVQFSFVSPGMSNTVALDVQGQLYVWGQNKDGLLGDDKISNFTSPELIGQTEYTSVFSGTARTYAIDKNGGLWAWGSNNNGLLGDGTTITRTSPVHVFSEKTFKSVSSNEHAIVIDNEGVLWAWGANYAGQLGDGVAEEDIWGQTRLENSMTLKRVKVDTTFVKAVAGATHNIALDENGYIWTWGSDISGQIGNASWQIFIANNLTSTPINIIRNTRFIDVAAGEKSSSAIDKDGNLWAWGSNSGLSFGNIDEEIITEPTKIMPGVKFVRVAAGNDFSAAIDEDGNIWIWGTDSLLCNSMTESSFTPVKVQSSVKFTQIAAGYDHCLALDENGNVWSLGSNSSGQLGNGTYQSSVSPVQVTDGAKFVSIAAGMYHSMALDENGNLWGWGGNSSGQLGNGAIYDQLSPMNLKFVI